MKSGSISRRVLLKSSTAFAAGALWPAPALIGRAEAAMIKLKLSSSLANDPKFANGRVYYDNLVRHRRPGLGDRSRSRSSPTISSARRSTSSTR